MLVLVSLGQMATSTLWFESRDEDFVDDLIDKNYDDIKVKRTLHQNTFFKIYFRMVYIWYIFAPHIRE